MIEHSGDDGRRLLRLSTTNSNNGLQWTTTLTAVCPAPNRGAQTVWIDVGSTEDPNSGIEPSWTTTAVPALARNILKATEAHGGKALLGPSPTLVTGADPQTIDRLFDVITDPERHITVVIAGALTGVPPDRWHKTVEKLLYQSVGLHAGYRLDRAAHQVLNEHLPQSHRIPEGALRTFLSDVQLDGSSGGRRHRVLSPKTIAEAFKGERLSPRLQ